MDVYSITQGPSVYPVDLIEVKSYLKIDYSVEDELLQGLVISATDILEKYTGRWFIARNAQGKWDRIRVIAQEYYPFIEIRRSPLMTLTLLERFQAGQWMAMTVDTDYQVKELSSYSRVLLFTSISVDNYQAYPLRASFIAGYGQPIDVPQPIKTAIKQLVNYMWLNRGDCVSQCSTGMKQMGGIYLPIAILSLVSAYRIINTFG